MGWGYRNCRGRGEGERLSDRNCRTMGRGGADCALQRLGYWNCRGRGKGEG